MDNQDESVNAKKKTSSYFIWTDEATFKLIYLRKKYEHLFTGRGHVKNAWEKIAEEIGGGTTSLLCRRKWENMIKKYKDLKKSSLGTSNEDGADTSVTWKFYIALDNMLADKHISHMLGDKHISPVILIDSGISQQNRFSPSPLPSSSHLEKPSDSVPSTIHPEDVRQANVSYTQPRSSSPPPSSSSSFSFNSLPISSAGSFSAVCTPRGPPRKKARRQQQPDCCQQFTQELTDLIREERELGQKILEAVTALTDAINKKNHQ